MFTQYYLEDLEVIMFKYFISASTLLMGIFAITPAQAATTTTVCAYDNWRGRWLCDSQTHYSQSEIDAIRAEIAQFEQDNPEGCNAPEDGLQLCWSYYKPHNKMDFYYELHNPKGYTQSIHGFFYVYKHGKLRYLFIFDRNILPKGENGYFFNHDGTVTVFDYKDDQRNTVIIYDPKNVNIKNSYTISADEALQRLNLPRSVLNLKVTPTPEALSQVRLPSGCSGSIKMVYGRPACNINMLKKDS